MLIGFFFSRFSINNSVLLKMHALPGILLSFTKYTLHRCSFAGIVEHIKDVVKDINVKNTMDIKSEMPPDTAFLSKYRKLHVLSSFLFVSEHLRRESVFFSSIDESGNKSRVASVTSLR